MRNKIKVARIVTVPIAFVHIRGWLSLLNESEYEKYDVELISSEGDYQYELSKQYKINVKNINILREISIKNDFIALIKLIKLFRREKYTIVHSSTPKAGMLTAVAGFIARVPIRFHTFTGQRWATLNGFLRFLMKLIDKLIITLNTRTYADSKSQIKFLISEGVAKEGQVHCLLEGSYGGIDLKRFNSDLYLNASTEIKTKFKIPLDHKIVLYVGRLTREKGVEDLVKTFCEVAKNQSKAHLFLLGPFEPELDQIDREILNVIEKHPQIKLLGFQKNPEYYMAGSDLLALLSHREGFGTVVLEAAAMGIPTLGTRIPGLVDSIVDQQTGVLVEKGDLKGSVEMLLRLITEDSWRNELGNSAKKRVQKFFSSIEISKAVFTEYEYFLQKLKRPNC